MPFRTPPARQVEQLHLLRAVRNLPKVRLAALRSPGLCPGPRKDRHTRRLTKTRVNDAWLKRWLRAVMPRAGGASSNYSRRLLDRPVRRTMTKKECCLNAV